MSPAVATLSKTKTTVLYRVGQYSVRFPVGDLPQWIAFYKRLRDRKRGRFAKVYQNDVDALVAVQRKLQE